MCHPESGDWKMTSKQIDISRLFDQKRTSEANVIWLDREIECHWIVFNRVAHQFKPYCVSRLRDERVVY